MSTGLRRFLYFTAAMTGAAIMIVEILGAKMLSPYIGTSHFVWTAQIAVTLVALACGYYLGGRLADRSQQLHRLFGAIFAAAVYLSFTVMVAEPVAYGCLNFNLAVGSLLASAFLFFVPLGLLAMTGPFLVRVITSSIAGVGGNVGRLTAISTLGSFGGTMLIGYVLIPFLPNSLTMYLTALVLMLLCVAYFVFFRRRVVGPVALLVLCAMGSGLPLKGTFHREYRLVVERFRVNSHFGDIQILDRRDSSIRYVLNDNLIQNAYDTVLRQSPLSFSYMLAGLPAAYNPAMQDALVVGMGVGIVPMDFVNRGMRVDTVEINPRIVEVAVRFFDFDAAKVNLVLGDGRHFLNRTSRQYDVVILDAFLGDSFPSHLMTRETFFSARKVLRPGGSLVVHSFGELQPGRDFLLSSLFKTLKAVFPEVRVHTTGEGAFFFVALQEPFSGSIPTPELAGVHPAARQEVITAFSGTAEVPGDAGLVLTDDYNPADYFDASNREILRRRLALAAKRM